jgi:hypothetical protein
MRPERTKILARYAVSVVLHLQALDSALQEDLAGAYERSIDTHALLP